jgi:FMN phosphatase YigB (HAD superfamily)
LVIVDLDNGLIDTRSDVRKHAKKAKYPFPVAYDHEGKIGKKFVIDAYPTAYLFGRDGEVIWHGEPSPETAEELEKMIVTALADRGDRAAQDSGHTPGPAESSPTTQSAAMGRDGSAKRDP